MTAHGFTAGPNVAESIDESGWGVRCHDGDLLGFGMLKGDAILYAAAPDLLAALIEVRDNVRDDSPAMWARVDAAIAAATNNF